MLEIVTPVVHTEAHMIPVVVVDIRVEVIPVRQLARAAVLLLAAVPHPAAAHRHVAVAAVAVVALHAALVSRKHALGVVVAS